MTATPKSPGWVYILTNEAMPGLVKIGLTTRTPKERAAELSRATGVLLPYVVAWARPVSDCAYVEKAVHRMLDDKRVNKDREGFRVTVKTGRQVIEAAAGSMLVGGWGYIVRQLWRSMLGLDAKRGRGRIRRKRRGDLTGFGLAVAGVVLVVVLVHFQPALPGWLPGPMGEAFSAIERLGG